jgi:hypothetical protein
VRAANEIRSVGRTYSAQHHRNMLGDRVFADVQFFADLDVGKAKSDKSQYAHLALRKFYAEAYRWICYDGGWHLFRH